MDAVTVGFTVFLPLAILFTLFYKFRTGKSKYRLPPGPPGKPFVGNLFDVDPDRVQESLVDLGKDFEDVFSVNFGNESVVVVKSIKAYRELHLQYDTAEKLSNRPTRFASTYVANGMDIVLAAESPGFRKRRNACSAAINRLEEDQEKLMLEELGLVVALLTKEMGKPQELDKPVLKFLANLCLVTLLGRRLEYDDPIMESILERNVCMQTMLLAQVDGVMNRFPWLRHIPFGYGKVYQRLMKLSSDQKEVILNQEKSSFDPQRTRGAIDEMLKLRQITEGETDSWLSDDHIWKSAESVIGAGIAAPTGGLLFFPIVAVRQPEVAHKIQKEIDQVIGRDRLPTLADRKSMPYTEAFILELLRYVSPAPTLVPRYTTEDLEFRDYLIPKGTTILTNSWEICHDKKLWDEPWKIRPERFLDKSGSLLPPSSEQRRNLVPFGSGKRACLGSSLYMSAAFLFISALLQRFDFQAGPGGLPPSDPHYHRISNVSIWPNSYKIVLKKRA